MAKILRTEQLSVDGDNIRLTATDGNLIINSVSGDELTQITSTTKIGEDISSLAVRDTGFDTDVSSLAANTSSVESMLVNVSKYGVYSLKTSDLATGSGSSVQTITLAGRAFISEPTVTATLTGGSNDPIIAVMISDVSETATTGVYQVTFQFSDELPATGETDQSTSYKLNILANVNAADQDLDTIVDSIDSDRDGDGVENSLDSSPDDSSVSGNGILTSSNPLRFFASDSASTSFYSNSSGYYSLSFSSDESTFSITTFATGTGSGFILPGDYAYNGSNDDLEIYLELTRTARVLGLTLLVYAVFDYNSSEDGTTSSYTASDNSEKWYRLAAASAGAPTSNPYTVIIDENDNYSRAPHFGTTADLSDQSGKNFKVAMLWAASGENSGGTFESEFILKVNGVQKF